MLIQSREMSRGELMCSHVDIEVDTILEIGALNRPLVPAASGRVYFADYTSRDELVQNHSTDPEIDTNDIVNVDYVIGARTLQEVVPKELHFGCVFASHVIEHVPDVISWLIDIEAILKPSGKLRLIVPDLRECFDKRRAVTQESELVGAFVERRRTPSAAQVYDFYRWHDRDGKLVHTAEQSLEMARIAANQYVDAHCWTFTPESFLALYQHILLLGLVKMKLDFITTTAPGEIDFFVGLSKPALGE